MDNLIKQLTDEAIENNTITPEQFKKNGIKRGLRNEDGTGVKTILTEISDVRGYKVNKGKIPIEGQLIYRGIEIVDLVDGFLKEERHGFDDTAYLLMFGKLPDQKMATKFSSRLARKRTLPEGFVRGSVLTFPSPDIMNKLIASVSVLYREDKNRESMDIDNVVSESINLIAKLPAIVAYSYHANRYHNEKGTFTIRRPDTSLSTAENFLHMLRSDGTYEPLEASILDMMLVLHADHGGGNNSTFTTHTVTSSWTDTYSCLAASLASLKGSRHGGANAKVMGMMDEIKGAVSNWSSERQVASYLKKILKKQAGDRSGLVYGMGHAVYTKSDPRAVLLKKKARELAHSKGRIDEFDLYETIVNITADLMKEAKGKNFVIAPNVDYYSGFVYDCMGIPSEVYTPLFAMSRIAGWSAHRIEELVNSGGIIRPASVYIGPSDVSYVPLKDRA
ncbi:MAG: citrate synthase [Planctomycetales bacterium 4572_13]|nr:MAG: citrate synthase [Planctomycetales bacterium 4572_13]